MAFPAFRTYRYFTCSAAKGLIVVHYFK